MTIMPFVEADSLNQYPLSLTKTKSLDHLQKKHDMNEQFVLNKQVSLNYLWNKTFNHLNQRIFRVRKSRILVSVNEIQRTKDGKVSLVKRNLHHHVF